MNRKLLILTVFVLMALITCGTKEQSNGESLDYTVKLEVVARHWDGVFNWTQARVATIPAYFKAKDDTTRCYASTVLHCRFDGSELTYIEHGDELTLNSPRGVYEPSLIFFKNRYYLTLRNDDRAYVTVSDDAMRWQPIKPWTFDDGAELGSYNTQQHWAMHSDGLFLVYTRRGANNDHIPRSRAPLFIACLDPEKLLVLLESERVLIPERGVMMGNFGVSIINEKEIWVTVGENMYPPENLDQGADGSVFSARIFWSRPNKLAF